MVKERYSAIGKRVIARTLRCYFVVTALSLLIAVPAADAAFFDTVGQSARPMGMGEVFIASSTGASGYWYNPAGLASIAGRQLGISYGMINPDITSDVMKYQLSYVNPIGSRSGFGVGISGLGADGASEMVISGAYGIALTESFSLGGNVRVLRWAIEGQHDPYTGTDDDDLSKVSFSLDVSAVYGIDNIFGLERLATGIYVKDAIMPNISESGDDDGKLPVEVGVGVMGTVSDITGEVDVAFVNGETIFRGGGEVSVYESALDLRAGVVYGSDFEDDVERTDIDFGIGYAFSSLVFDYAYVIPIAFNDTGGRHFVSFGLSF
jgi:hypothetical protein